MVSIVARSIPMITTTVIMALLFLAVPGAAQESTPGVDRAVTVGKTTIAWGESWEYVPDSSAEDRATLRVIDQDAGRILLATYGEFLDDTVDDREAALDRYAEVVFAGVDLEAITARDAGELANGAVWKVYDFELDGVVLTMVISVGESAEGAFVISMLTGNADSFAEIVQRTQEEILVNDETVFLDGVEGAAIASTVATPEASTDKGLSR
jgi:hypothetical protein